jgi:hypothetical protein
MPLRELVPPLMFVPPPVQMFVPHAVPAPPAVFPASAKVLNRAEEPPPIAQFVGVVIWPLALGEQNAAAAKAAVTAIDLKNFIDCSPLRFAPHFDQTF